MPSLEGGEIVYDTGTSLIYQRPGQRGFELFNPREGYFTSLGSGFTDLQELLDTSEGLYVILMTQLD